MDLDYVRAQQAAGRSLADIGADPQVQLSAGALSRRLRGETGNHPPAVTREDLTALIRQGCTSMQVADVLGCTASTVNYYARKYRLFDQMPTQRPERIRGVTDEERHDLHLWYVRDGETLDAIAARMGCSHSTVQRRLLDAGIELRSPGVGARRAVPT